MNASRRSFLCWTAAAGGSVALSALRPTTTRANQTSIPIVDTHQHLWDLKSFQPPWLESASSKISVRHDSNDYAQAVDGLNLTHAVYMEVDAAVADQNKEADLVLDLIRSKRTVTVAAVISGRPNSDQFAKYMERFRNESAIKGVRQVLHGGSTPAGYCLDPQFVKSVQLLGAMDKSFDLCMRPSELGDGVKLVAQCPDTRFIVDHLGNADPHAWGFGDSKTKPTHTVDQWKRDMAALAAIPRVICKVSGIVARMPEGWKPEELAPAINFCLDTFGPNRVVFGGDWPVCKLGATFAEWVNALKQIVQSRPMADQHKLFHENAKSFYRLT